MRVVRGRSRHLCPYCGSWYDPQSLPDLDQDEGPAAGGATLPDIGPPGGGGDSCQHGAVSQLMVSSLGRLTLGSMGLGLSLDSQRWVLSGLWSRVE